MWEGKPQRCIPGKTLAGNPKRDLWYLGPLDWRWEMVPLCKPDHIESAVCKCDWSELSLEMNTAVYFKSWNKLKTLFPLSEGFEFKWLCHTNAESVIFGTCSKFSLQIRRAKVQSLSVQWYDSPTNPFWKKFVSKDLTLRSSDQIAFQIHKF